MVCVQLETQRQEASELTSTALTKEESLEKLQVEVYRLSSSVSALRSACSCLLQTLLRCRNIGLFVWKRLSHSVNLK